VKQLSFLQWNVQSVISKLSDLDFCNIVSKYDILLFCETWHSNISNIDIKGFESFNCPRPKYNRRAQRHSGGVIVYFKSELRNKLQLVSINTKGIIWFKLKKECFSLSDDLFVCTCYIPPEDSKLYKNPNSSLFEFDFFECLNIDIKKYSNLGEVCVTGDLNSRTADHFDFIENINLDRFVNLPLSTYDSEVHVICRKNNDTGFNNFGKKNYYLLRSKIVSLL
jgi:hypothetical protein